MDNVHCLPGLRKIRAESEIKVIRCGKYSHQRTISVGGHLIPAAQNRLHPFFIPEQRLRRCNSAVEPFPPRRVFPILIPVQKTLHDIMGMDAPCFPNTLSQAQGQASIVRPCPFRLSICPSVRHLRDRLPLQSLPAAKFYRHSQRVPHTYSVNSAANHIYSICICHPLPLLSDAHPILKTRQVILHSTCCASKRSGGVILSSIASILHSGTILAGSSFPRSRLRRRPSSQPVSRNTIRTDA